MPFVFNDPLHWIIKASEAREIAAQMTDLGARTDMLTIAHEYEKIAQRAAERLGAIQVAKPCEQTGVTIKLSTTRRSHDLPRLHLTATMPSRYTVWVKNEQQGKKLVVVCDPPDVSAAIRQALERAAREWECSIAVLSVYGIAEGDVNGGLH